MWYTFLEGSSSARIQSDGRKYDAPTLPNPSLELSRRCVCSGQSAAAWFLLMLDLHVFIADCAACTLRQLRIAVGTPSPSCVVEFSIAERGIQRRRSHSRAIHLRRSGHLSAARVGKCSKRNAQPGADYGRPRRTRRRLDSLGCLQPSCRDEVNECELTQAPQSPGRWIAGNQQLRTHGLWGTVPASRRRAPLLLPPLCTRFHAEPATWRAERRSIGSDEGAHSG